MTKISITKRVKILQFIHFTSDCVTLTYIVSFPFCFIWIFHRVIRNINIGKGTRAPLRTNVYHLTDLTKNGCQNRIQNNF